MRNRYLLGIVLILFFASCGVRKSAVVVKEPTAPILKDTIAEVKKEVPVVPVVIPPDTLTLGLLLPLQLDAHFANDTIPDAEPLIIPEALPAINFLEGVKVAIDSLNPAKLFVRLKVLDVAVDSAAIVKLMNGSALAHCDAAIVMLPVNYNLLVAATAQKLKIPLITLQGSNTQYLESAASMWIAIPSNSTQIRLMSAFLVDKFPNSNFITVYRDVRKENDLATVFATAIDTAAGKKGTCSKVNYQTGGWTALQAKMVKQKRNLIIIPTTDESYLSSLLIKLDEVQKDYPVMLCGLPPWEGFETIDPKLLENLNTYFFNGIVADIDHPRVQKFRKSFIAAYHADPLLQVYQGYDLATYLSQNFLQFKRDFSSYKSIPNLESPESGFQFKAVCPGCGLENQTMNMLHYNNYKLLRVVR